MVVLDPATLGYIQLGLVALAFGALQVWWIGSVLRGREQAPQVKASGFREALEPIGARTS
jgi:hypothetical protein